jgi:NAD(P)-dependent dehydrogenase (short-subunit alcohol dehydrogenase family)
MYMQVLAAEEPDLVVMAVQPGVVETEMLKDVMKEGKNVFDKQTHERLQKAWDSMVQPEQPGEQFAKLALGAPKEFSGKVMRWDDKPILDLK